MKSIIKPLLKHLADFLNFSLLTGSFPSKLKIDRITPVFK